MNYLNMIMNRLANIVHNASQDPNEDSCHHVLDSLSRLVKEYNEDFGQNVDLTDYRKKS